MRFIVKYVILLVLTVNLHSQTRHIVRIEQELIFKSLELAKSQVGVKEVGNNGGKQVTEYLQSVGLRAGNPWCMSFQYWCFYKTAKVNPIPRSGHCVTVFNGLRKKSIETKPATTIQVGDLLFWANVQNFGHVARIIEVGAGGWVYTIEGNTSSGVKGSQDDGDGVYIRKRNYLHPLGNKRFLGLVGFYE